MIYIARNGSTLGFFSIEELQAKVAAGEILRTDDAWTTGMSEWKPLDEVVKIDVEPPPIPPPKRVAAAQPPPPPLGSHNSGQSVLPQTSDGFARDARSSTSRNPVTGIVIGISLLLIVIIAFWVARNGVENDSKNTHSRSDVQSWETNLIRYKTRNGFYPTQQQGLEALVTEPNSDPKPKIWMQYSISKDLTDPWGQKYQYRNPGKHNPSSYDVFSLGPDGREGSQDDNGNW